MSRVTSKDIAQRAGVSRTTVSFVINGRMDLPVAAETRKRVLQVAEEMGYVPNASARGLVTGRTQMIGIVADRPTDPHYAGLLEDLLLAARQADYHLLFVSSQDDNSSLLAVESRLDGLIVIGNSFFSQRLLENSPRIRVPYVVIGCLQYSPQYPQPANAVEWMDKDGGRLAAEHLLKLGHRNLAILAGRVDETHPKVRGFLDATARTDAKTVVLDCADERDQYEAGCRMFETLRREHPDVTAVFCRNDLIALGVLFRAAQLGLRIPQDLSVLGYSDIPAAQYAVPALSTIATPIRQAGLKALEMLLATLREQDGVESRVELPVRLMERASTAPPSSNVTT